MKVNFQISIIVAVLVLLASTVHAQRYMSEEVINRAENYLKEIVGNELYSYFEYDAHTYYSYKNFLGKQDWATLNAKNRTRGKFIESNVRFLLVHPEFSHSKYPRVKNWIGIKLDNNLELVQKPNLDHIPNFLLNGEPSNFLTENDVLEILRDLDLQDGIKPLNTNLEFDIVNRQHVWVVRNTLFEEKCYSQVELIKLHAITGEVLFFEEEEHFVMHCIE